MNIMLNFERKSHIYASDKAGGRIPKGGKWTDSIRGWILKFN